MFRYVFPHEEGTPYPDDIHTTPSEKFCKQTTLFFFFFSKYLFYHICLSLFAEVYTRITHATPTPALPPPPKKNRL